MVKTVRETNSERPNKESEPLSEMARIRQTKSGLPMIVWLKTNDGTNTMPNIKFQDNTDTQFIEDDMVPISVHPTNPTILAKNYSPNLPSQAICKLKEWIIKNHTTLMAYWNNEIFEDELIDNIQPV